MRYGGRSILTSAQRPGWKDTIRRSPTVSAWPFVVVILAQMAIGGLSVYALSAIRAYVTAESLWSKGQHEAIYFLNLYLDTQNPQHFGAFKRTIAVPLADLKGRALLEQSHPDVEGAVAALRAAGNPEEDVPRLAWTFLNFRGFPYLEDAVARWKETDRDILELERLGRQIGAKHPGVDASTFRARLEELDAEMTPRTVAFSRALGDGARVVEALLMVVNLAFACLLAGLTVWRVGKFMSQRQQIETKLAWQASHDELTGLVNRRALEEKLRAPTRPARDAPAAPRSLMFIDLDQFKIVNDTCGHAAGDALLRRICPAVRDALGPDDLLARLGGDEFSVFMEGADLALALSTAERVRLAVEQVGFVWEGRPFGVTASIGLVNDADGSMSPDEMMRAADMACFMAKEKGRNRIQAHCEKDESLLVRVREMNWAQRIHQGLNEDRFCLYAQEIVPLAGAPDAGLHLELLIRMRDEMGALVPPSSFLPAAERFGLIGLVDRWVVRQAFRTLADRRAVKGAIPVTCCGINLSGATIGDDAFLDFLKSAFAEFRVSPATICFEVTETSAIVNLDAARDFIQDLRRFGCTFALDDFGSGMSSFNYLKSLPVDLIKIDGGFVKNLLTDRADRAMVEMINHVGHVMGKEIIAEFVETAEIADALRDIGVDYGQGYGLAAPRPFTARFQAMARTKQDPLERFDRLIA